MYLKKDYYLSEKFFITIGFENFENFNFQFPIFKFINLKNTTNSFIYSLVEQFFETHFTKIITGGKGYTFGKNLTKFSVLYTSLPGVWGILYEQKTPVFPSGQANLKRNPGENPDVDSIPLKYIMIFKQAEWIFELSNRTDSRSKSELAGINNTVRSYLYSVNTTPTDYPITEKGIGIGEGR